MLDYITAGESHGPALTTIVSGLPAGLTVDVDDVDKQLARRQAGYGRSPRQQIERDSVTILSGLRHGTTLGTPMAMLLNNADHANWTAAMSPLPTDAAEGNWRDRKTSLVRPGHADLAGMARGDFDELRPVLERASARETAMRVAAGAVAQQFLAAIGIHVRAHVTRIGGAAAPGHGDGSLADIDWAQLDESPVRCLDPDATCAMIEAIDAARADRDTLGGEIDIVAWGCPPGLGGYATGGERLGGRLAAAAMSVHAMKAVQIGAGTALGSMCGSDAHDEVFPATRDGVHEQGMGVGRASNRAGGLEGGMTNGAPITMRVTMKPLPTLMRPLASVDLASGEAATAHAERSDTCAVPAAAVVLECVTAFELARAVRERFGMAAMSDVLHAWNHYCDRVGFASDGSGET